jgi:hypothetical protein
VIECLDAFAATARSQETLLTDVAKRVPVLLQSALHTVFGGTGRTIEEGLDGAKERSPSEDGRIARRRGLTTQAQAGVSPPEQIKLLLRCKVPLGRCCPSPRRAPPSV